LSLSPVVFHILSPSSDRISAPVAPSSIHGLSLSFLVFNISVGVLPLYFFVSHQSLCFFFVLMETSSLIYFPLRNLTATPFFPPSRATGVHKSQRPPDPRFFFSQTTSDVNFD